MDKEKMLERFKEKLDEWESAQNGLLTAYDYEKKYDELWTELGREMLQESVGKEEVPRKKKPIN